MMQLSRRKASGELKEFIKMDKRVKSSLDRCFQCSELSCVNLLWMKNGSKVCDRCFNNIREFSATRVYTEQEALIVARNDKNKKVLNLLKDLSKQPKIDPSKEIIGIHNFDCESEDALDCLSPIERRLLDLSRDGKYKYSSDWVERISQEENISMYTIGGVYRNLKSYGFEIKGGKKRLVDSLFYMNKWFNQHAKPVVYAEFDESANKINLSEKQKAYIWKLLKNQVGMKILPSLTSSQEAIVKQARELKMQNKTCFSPDVIFHYMRKNISKKEFHKNLKPLIDKYRIFRENKTTKLLEFNLI